jgi:hypothetical protein
MITRLNRLNSSTLKPLLEGNAKSWKRSMYDKKNTVVSLASSGSANEKCFLAVCLLSRVRTWLRSEHENEPFIGPKPRLVIAIDEAHVMLRKSNDKNSSDQSNMAAFANKFFDELIVEIRQLGGVIILLDQSPSLLTESALFGTGNKVCFALASGQDYASVAECFGVAGNRASAFGALPNRHAYFKASSTMHLSLFKTTDSEGA